MSSQMINEENFECGSIDENGIVSNLEKMGMTPYLAIKELIANSIDANATTIFINKEEDITLIIDNGDGMSRKTIENGFRAYYENHSNEKKLGVSGIGLKTATLCLCKNNDDTYTIVRIYTFGKDGYFVIDVPWTEIMAEKKYTNKINVRQMNQEEIEFFKSKLGNNTGTLYVFKNTKNINDVIQEYIIGFKNIRLDKQIGFIFGRFNIDMRYNGIPIKKYDYFGGKDSDYIIKEQIHISVLLNNKNNSIEYYIKKDDTYYDAINNVKCTKEMKHIGDMYLDLACRNMRNNKAGTNKIEISKANILKDNDNKDNKNNNDKGYSKISDYDLEYNDFISNYEFLTEPYSLTSLVRNGQHINGISIHGLKHSSTRGGDKDALKKCGIRSELSYSTFSNQSGFMDKELGIQGNKNQHSGKLPEKLTSLIKNSRYDAYNKLKKILETNIEQPSIEQPSIEQPSI